MNVANTLKSCLLASAVGMIVLTTGCATGLNTIQQTEYSTMKSEGVLVEEKDPNVGVILGILPGGGSFYAREPGLGVVNLLLWPASILWDPISGAQGAKAINYQTTKAKLKRDMAKEMSELEDQLSLGTIDNATFIRNKQTIEAKYTFD